MKLVFFGLSLSSSWGNGHATTYRALLRALHARGHPIVFYERDQPWYAAHRDLERADYADLRFYTQWQQARAAALATVRAADAVIVGSYCGQGGAILDDLLQHRPRRLAFYDIDTPVTLEALDHHACEYLRADHIAAVDLYLSFTSGPMLEELARRGARRPRPLHCCADPDHCLPAAPRTPRWDLGYLGTYAPDRQDKLQRLLLEPARRLPRRRFAVAGSLYPERDSWPANVERLAHLPPAAHPAFYRSCRLTLNLTRRAMVCWGYSPSIRLFEAAACESPIVSDPWPGLDDFFQSGQELLVTDDSDAMVRWLRHASPRDLKRTARAARIRFLAEHTGAHRARQLETYLAEIGG